MCKVMRLMIWLAFPSQNTNTSPKPQVHKPEIWIIHCMLILQQYYSTKWTLSPQMCVYSHTKFIWNSAQLCMYAHMNLAQLCMYSHKVHLERSTTVHVLTQGSFGTQHNCECTQNKVHLELSTTVHVLTHELSTNVHVFTHELSTTVHVLA